MQIQPWAYGLLICSLVVFALVELLLQPAARSEGAWQVLPGIGLLFVGAALASAALGSVWHTPYPFAADPKATTWMSLGACVMLISALWIGWGGGFVVAQARGADTSEAQSTSPTGKRTYQQPPYQLGGQGVYQNR